MWTALVWPLLPLAGSSLRFSEQEPHHRHQSSCTWRSAFSHCTIVWKPGLQTRGSYGPRRPFMFVAFKGLTLALWLIKPADLSRDLKIFSLCLHLVILPAFAPWAHLILKVMRADFEIGYCILSQTHTWLDTHDLMTWLWTADRSCILCAPGAQEAHRAANPDRRWRRWSLTRLE